MKIAIQVWYYDKEPIITVINELVRRGHQVFQLPMKEFGLYHIKWIDYALEELSNIRPDLVIAWNWNIAIEYYERAIKICPRFILFNWDDPHCWCVGDLRRLTIDKLSKYFEKACVSSSQCLQNYLDHGSRVSKFLLPPLSVCHYSEVHPDFECDVAFVITNLYERFNHQMVPRKKLVDAISNLDIKFHLYGPKFLQDSYPKNYRGEISFERNRLVFSNAKICLNHHVITGKDYLNERTITIMGSGGLMLTDANGGHTQIMDKAVVYNSISDCIIKIKDILQNYDKYAHLRTSSRLYALEMWSAEKWVDTLLN